MGSSAPMNCGMGRRSAPSSSRKQARRLRYGCGSEQRSWRAVKKKSRDSIAALHPVAAGQALK